MKALPLDQTQLVEMQRLDLSIARLLHQQKTHPVRESLAALQSRAQDLRGAIVAARAEQEGLERQIQAVEEEVHRVKERRALQQSRLNEGKVPLRDMSAMEHEIASMDARITALDDRTMELMEESEKLQGGIQAAEENAGAIEVKEARLQEELNSDLSQSGDQIAGLTDKRDRIAASLPQRVLQEYARLQSRLGPRVVLEMRDGALIDPPVELPVAEISELATFPADLLYQSEETEYLVARTSRG